MKKLGLIGGTGPDSTVSYYRAITSAVRERTGELPPLAIESLSAFRVFDFNRRKDYAGLVEYLLAGLKNLKAAGCEFAAFTGITPHIVFGEVSARAGLELVSVIGAAREEAAAKGYGRVGLLGTSFTMNGTFFQSEFEQANIAVVIPNASEREFLGEKIETELEHGAINPLTRERTLEIVARMTREEGIEAIVLGCTELPLLLGGFPAAAPYLDVVETHTKKLVETIIKG